MSLRLQIIIGVLLILFVIVLVNMVRKEKIELRYALPWSLMIVALFIMDLFPSIPGRLAEMVGIELSVNMLFFLGFVFALCIIFTQSLSISRNQKKVKQMAQEIALLKERIERVEEKKNGSSKEISEK